MSQTALNCFLCHLTMKHNESVDLFNIVSDNARCHRVKNSRDDWSSQHSDESKDTTRSSSFMRHKNKIRSRWATGISPCSSDSIIQRKPRTRSVSIDYDDDCIMDINTQMSFEEEEVSFSNMNQTTKASNCHDGSCSSSSFLSCSFKFLHDSTDKFYFNDKSPKLPIRYY